MTKLKGRVKSISVKEVTEKVQILHPTYTTGSSTFIIGKVDEDYIELCNSGRLIDMIPKKDISKLKTLVVEYEYSYKDDFDIDWVHTTKQLPLKYSQWQATIDSGVVDNDKEVEFEIVVQDGPHPNDRYFEYAKIIPQKKRMYSEEDVHNLMMQAWINGQANPTSPYTVREYWINKILKSFK